MKVIINNNLLTIIFFGGGVVKLYIKICVTASLIMAITVYGYKMMFEEKKEEISVAATVEEIEDKTPEA